MRTQRNDELFRACHEKWRLDIYTGELYYRKPNNTGRYKWRAGDRCEGSNGLYRNVHTPLGPLGQHVVNYLMTFGVLPARGYDVHHINRNRRDNRPGNLQIVTRAENNRNLTARRGRKLPPGIWMNRAKYCAAIQREGVRYRKTFATVAAAVEWHRAQLRKLGFAEEHQS